MTTQDIPSQKKNRKPLGGALQSRGAWFARVVHDGKRVALVLPWASSREEAETRAHELQSLITGLVDAGHTTT